MAPTNLDLRQSVRAGPGEEWHTPTVHVAGHELRLFVNSGPLIDAMVADIAAARDRVWMETYIYSDDRAGRAVADALIERAQAGLDVRLMYDAVGSLAAPASLFNRMREGGVQVHAYHTLAEALRRFSLFRVFNRRNHRKLLVVDDRIAYFGGMNVVDQSEIDTPREARRHLLPPSAGWRDVHVRLDGPQQHEIARAFEYLWLRAHHRRRRRPRRWPLREMLRAADDSIWFFDFRPTLRSRRADRVFAPLIRRARRSITVSMAYFVPEGRVFRDLIRARRRGAAVRIIVPGESDVPLVQAATRHLYGFLLSRGFEIYERNDQMLHSKVMVIDDLWSVVGSCNIDPRSFRLNLEFLAVARSADLAAALLDICNDDIENSRRITDDDCRRRGWWRRLLDRTAWSMRRWL